MKAFILAILLYLGIAASASAQDNVYMSPGLGVGFFQDTVMIYGKLTLNGGSVVFNPKANVFFFGDTLKIIPGTTVSGSGKLIFKGAATVPVVRSFTQFLDAGGVKLGSIVIDNPNDLHLAGSNAGSLDTLRFINGKLYLNGKDFILGNGNPGFIDGYDQDRFVVTNSPIANSTGFLMRENVGAANQVFPIGPIATSYEPAALENNGTPDNFKMRVAPGVNEFLFSGKQQNERSTQTTWFVYEENPGGSNANLYLQHNTWHEGNVFYAYRPWQFISRYVGYSPNTEGDTLSLTNWDNFGMAGTQPGTSPGYLTTSTPLASTMVTFRTGLKEFGAFAKTTWQNPYLVMPLPVEFISINASWKNAGTSNVGWSVANDEDAISYTVERRLPNQTDFAPIQRVNAKNLPGLVSYNISDNLADVTGTIYYRITATDKNGREYQSDIASLFRHGDGAGFAVGPIPATDHIRINTFGFDANEAPLEVTAYNAAGAEVYNGSEQTGLSMQLQTSTWPEGIYILHIRHGETFQIQKIMVLNQQ